KLVLNALGDAQAVLGIKPIVRVAERVNVALGAGHLARGNLENLCKARSVKVARRANLNLRISGLGDERRKPADFQLESDKNNKKRADSSSHFCASHDISETFLKTGLERMGTVRSHHE